MFLFFSQQLETKAITRTKNTKKAFYTVTIVPRWYNMSYAMVLCITQATKSIRISSKLCSVSMVEFVAKHYWIAKVIKLLCRFSSIKMKTKHHFDQLLVWKIFATFYQEQAIFQKCRASNCYLQCVYCFTFENVCLDKIENVQYLKNLVARSPDNENLKANLIVRACYFTFVVREFWASRKI